MEDRKKLGVRIVRENKSELDQLEKLTKLGYTLSEIEYTLKRLKEVGSSEQSQSAFYENAVLHTTLAVAYGRLFGSGQNVTKLDANSIPEKYKQAHEELIFRRKKRFAHHDNHPSITTDREVLFDGDTFTVFLKINRIKPLEIPNETDGLLEWIREDMQKKTVKMLRRLEKKSGYKWCVGLPRSEDKS